MKVVPIDSNDLDNLSPSSSIKLFCSLFSNEIDKIWNNIVTAKGGFLNFDAIFKISDFAIFLPNLNKVISFLIIKFSNHYELKQYHQKDFYKNIYENYFFPSTLLIHLD